MKCNTIYLIKQKYKTIFFEKEIEVTAAKLIVKIMQKR
jgi:hypothetical protein